MSDAAAVHGHGLADEATKRDFLKLVTGGAAAIGTVAFAWPLIDSMHPARDALTLSSVEPDFSPFVCGAGVTVMWQGAPVFVRHHTKQEIKAAQGAPLARLIDPQADSARAEPDRAQWIVLAGIGTHLGCVPPGCKAAGLRGDRGGWCCPCHGSQYDTSGRVRHGPAPANLAVPPYAFDTDTKIKIG
ncbi:MAG TPA: ubiquinol-cytochrome c reductase iron-sulfur subunit [Acetobacteraceae bacterium]|nr:ubiquinol-cytochrome c reductase iron-sulfur subunit [Acetobacteraceae bacterium]